MAVGAGAVEAVADDAADIFVSGAAAVGDNTVTDDGCGTEKAEDAKTSVRHIAILTGNADPAKAMTAAVEFTAEGRIAMWGGITAEGDEVVLGGVVDFVPGREVVDGNVLNHLEFHSHAGVRLSLGSVITVIAIAKHIDCEVIQVGFVVDDVGAINIRDSSDLILCKCR